MSFEDLLTLAMINEALAPAEVLPPRPANTLPEFAVTTQGKVFTLRKMTPKQWEFFDIKKVTGRGWAGWYPVEFRDRRVFAVLKRGKKAKGEKKREPPPADYLTRPR